MEPFNFTFGGRNKSSFRWLYNRPFFLCLAVAIIVASLRQHRTFFSHYHWLGRTHNTNRLQFRIFSIPRLSIRRRQRFQPLQQFLQTMPIILSFLKLILFIFSTILIGMIEGLIRWSHIILNWTIRIFQNVIISIWIINRWYIELLEIKEIIFSLIF
jgi:hypothetical protein